MTTSAPWPLSPEDVPAPWHTEEWDVDEDVLLAAAPPPTGRAGSPRRDLHERLINAHGGIVSARELRQAGIAEEHIRILRDYGSLRRIRKGWYCSPALGAVHVLAWRIGGPLACVSALVHHGLLTASEVAHASELHVGRASNSSRRLSAIGVRAAADELRVPELGRAPVLHWSTRDFRSGSRLAVSVETALEQARHCQPLLAARAAAAAAQAAPAAN